ncbi:hypothetical protein Tco_0642891 [Tanacetum coccineum]
MANLEFCDSHNMVAYLKKPEGSEEFHQIVDFLNASHIRYALTKNPTIYVSLIKQFWETATARTLDNGEIELTATIDGKVKIVTEASVRRHLQLADSDGISSLPNTEIFEQLSLMGTKLSPAKLEEELKLFSLMMKKIWRMRKISEIDQDPTISLVQHDEKIQGRQEHDMEFAFDLDAAKDASTAEEDISTAKPVSTAGVEVTTASVYVSTATISTTKDKGKGIMEESEPVQTKTKLQQEQERLGYKAALKLQAKLEEEERQRIASVQEAASSFNIEEWDDIQARVEADEELAQRLQAEEREKYSEAEKARLLAKLINQRIRYFAAQKAKERRNKPAT